MPKKIGIILVLLCCVTILHGTHNKQEAAISYNFNGGRFGDTMLTLYKALWLSWKYKIPLLYKEFPYANQMHLHTLLTHKYKEYVKQTKMRRVVNIHDELKQPILHHKNIAYVIDYYSHLVDWHDADKGLFLKHKDVAFTQYLRSMVKPCVELSLVVLPKGIKSVAVHVRKGGGFDNPLLSEACLNSPIDIKNAQHDYADVGYPTKFPPDSYYIEQIKRISEILNDQPLYIYLFTDDRNPQRLVDKYSREINKKNIIFDYRKEGNAHNAHVLEDFFSMTQFDCLIRNDSSFSKAAHMLADYDIAIYPEHYIWQDNTLIIDRVNVVTKE